MSASADRVVRIVAALGVTFFFLGIQIASAGSKTPRPASHPRVTVNTKSSPASFRPEMGFGEAIGILRHATIPPVNIVVIWKDLSDNADIDRETEIGMDGVRGVPLRTHLELLLTAVAADNPTKLRYMVRGGVILIGTEEGLRPKPVTRVYDVTDLTSPPANYFFLAVPLLIRTLPIGLPLTPVPLGTGTRVR